MSTASRRDFFRWAGVSAALCLAARAFKNSAVAREAEIIESFGDAPPPENLAAKGEVPRRKFGKTDVVVSAMALGGHTFATAKTEAESIRIVQEAVDAGITFMDNAWEYHDGRSEELMGMALEGRRDKVFLMTKLCSHGRDKAFSMKQLEESLRRLKTDYLDLWQIHEVVYDDDPDRHFAKGGAVEALEEAKKQGKARFVGFTGHKSPEIHKKMLSRGFAFDAVQLPLCGFDAGYRSFEREILPILVKNGIAPIGMKSLNGNAAAVKKGVIGAAEAIRYAMSLPVTTTVSGIDSLEILRQNLEIARSFVPMTVQEKAAFRKKCAVYAGDGRFELYKSSMQFDGPPGREQHGFPPKKELAG
ncbi:MAG: aldo/keto reductase [Verrucomicrobiota bacterium]|nr:aldo/keto reductase [Verrucomicrobiota bacterium]